MIVNLVEFIYEQQIKRVNDDRNHTIYTEYDKK